MSKICSKLTIKTPERFLTLNRFHTLFWCRYCWLWTSKCQPGKILQKSVIDGELKTIIFCCKIFHIKCLWNFYTHAHFLLLTRLSLSRSSHQRCSLKKAAFKNLAVFIEKQLYWSLFLIKLQIWRITTSLKGDSNTGNFLWILQNV